MNKRGRTLFILSFLMPAVLLYGVFVVYPLIQTFILGFYRWKGVSAKITFIGLDNYKSILTDDVFWKALTNNLLLLVVGGLVLIGAGVGIALAMQGQDRVAKSVRAIYLFPQVVSMIVVAIIWRFMFNPAFGLVPKAGEAMKIAMPEAGILATPNLAKLAILIAFVWHGIGFYVMLFGAGIQSIDTEVIEAAELDGSSGWHRFSKVIWPLLWSVKKVATVYVVSNVTNLFGLVFIMTQGGPDHATDSLLYLLYDRNSQSLYGYAAAMGAVNFVVAMALSGLVLVLTGKNPERTRTSAVMS